MGRLSLKPGAGGDTGNIPFAALDLLSKKSFAGPRLYRHDAESFAWCLVYICICMEKDDEGRVRTIKPHPLSSWFRSLSGCFCSKSKIFDFLELLDELCLHQTTVYLAFQVCHYWLTESAKRRQAATTALAKRWERPIERVKADGTEEESLKEKSAKRRHSAIKALVKKWEKPSERLEADDTEEESSKKTSDHEHFKQVLLVIHDTSDAIPESRIQDARELMELVYPFFLKDNETEKSTSVDEEVCVRV